MWEAPGSLIRLSDRPATHGCGKSLGCVGRPVEGAGPGAAAAGRLEDWRSAADPGDRGIAIVRTGRCVVTAVCRAVAFTGATAIVLRGGPAPARARDSSHACKLRERNQQGENRRQFRSSHHRFLYHFQRFLASRRFGAPGTSRSTNRRVKGRMQTYLQKPCQECFARSKSLISRGLRVILGGEQKSEATEP